MAFSLQDWINYYANLLIIQYNEQPKAIATVALMAQFAALNQLAFNVQDAFDIDTATGVQLDTLGNYVDLDRYYLGQVFVNGDWFGFVSYGDLPSDLPQGFADYDSEDLYNGKTLNYSDVLSSNTAPEQLSDDEFRILIKLRIVQNNINTSCQSIDSSLFYLFGTSIFQVDNYDMSMTYFVATDILQLMEVAAQKGVLPKPMGVRIQGLIEYDGTPYFGFASYDNPIQPSFMSGFADYDSEDLFNGHTLGYDDVITV